jgi:hypothetical protein
MAERLVAAERAGPAQGDPAPGDPRRALRARLQRLELGGLALALLAVWPLARDLEWSPRCGALCGYAAAVLLGQGLLRDLARLALASVGGVPRAPLRRLRCLCAESTLGLGLLGAGLLLLLAGLEEPVRIDRPRLLAGLVVLLGVGFLAKDYVLVVRREEDHGSIAVG